MFNNTLFTLVERQGLFKIKCSNNKKQSLVDSSLLKNDGNKAVNNKVLQKLFTTDDLFENDFCHKH